MTANGWEGGVPGTDNNDDTTYVIEDGTGGRTEISESDTVYGYDETIQRSFKGEVEKEITSDGGKALVKAINMCKCTGITVPGEKLASGFVICGKHGKKGMFKAFDLAKEIDLLIEKNEIFQRYFIRRDKFIEPIHIPK